MKVSLFTKKTIPSLQSLVPFFIILFSFFSLHFSFAETSHSIILQLSSLPEAKIGYTFSYKLPFLQGNSPLTENNNLRFSLSAEASPVSLQGVFGVVWTPIAFLEFSAGGRLGTGFVYDLFGNPLNGLGVTQAIEGTDEREVVKHSGLYQKYLVSGTFQFDLAAIVPGDWNHVVFLTYHELNYAANSNAKGTESWIFENDDGENVNGFKYYANAVIGYQMPIFLQMVAFLTEMELNLYDIPNKSTYGGDLPQWTFSNMLNFNINKHVDIAVITQFRTRKNYEKDLTKFYYRDMTANKLNVEFYRVAAITTFKF